MPASATKRILVHYGGVSLADDIARDQALVATAKRDPQAFGAIFDLYYGKILTYALKRVGDVALAEDIAAETFTKALRGLPLFSWRGIPISAWLYRIAGNEIKMHYRKAARRTLSLELLMFEGFDVADEQVSLEREELSRLLAQQEQFALVAQALRVLKPHYQEAISLRYMEGKEIYEVASIMHRREGTVRSLLSRGLKLLKALLEEPQQNAPARITTDEGRSVLQALTQNQS